MQYKDKSIFMVPFIGAIIATLVYNSKRTRTPEEAARAFTQCMYEECGDRLREVDAYATESADDAFWRKHFDVAMCTCSRCGDPGDKNIDIYCRATMTSGTQEEFSKRVGVLASLDEKL